MAKANKQGKWSRLSDPQSERDGLRVAEMRIDGICIELNNDPETATLTVYVEEWGVEREFGDAATTFAEAKELAIELARDTLLSRLELLDEVAP